MTPTLSRPLRSFTLVELLVVICILGILMGLAIVGVQKAIEAGKVTSTQSMIQALDLAIENFSTENGAIPASLNTIDESFGHDEINCGIETVLMMLRSQDARGEPFDISKYADRIKDEDDMGLDASVVYEALNVPPGNKPYFLELVDAWGNPLAYIPRESFGETFMIQDANGDIVEIEAVDHSGFGLTQAFLLWSFGPDGKNDNGGGDDIRNWQINEDDAEE